jgi:hypothetical protein
MTSLDPLEHYHYGLQLQVKLRSETGDAFQRFFSDIMQRRHGADFQATQPWGALGDRKCDGYLRSSRRLFACYAPQEADFKTTQGKLHSDFNGALPHQGKFWDEWCFVHNSADGRLATDLVIEIEGLRAKHSTVRLEVLGAPELIRMALELPRHELIAMLGVAPTLRNLANLGLDDVAETLHAITTDGADPGDFRPTPPGKIEFNRLSKDVEHLIKLGLTKADLVGRYFANHSDPNYGDRVVARFRTEYLLRKGRGDDSNAIYDQLFQLIVGPVTPSGKTQTAAHAVLAYLFEQCEIFERPVAMLPAP